MKDFGRLRIRFKQFGGWRLVVQYARMGVLWIGVKEIIRCALTGKSFKAIYPIITQKVDGILYKRYGCLMSSKNSSSASVKFGQENIIWFCWLQGLEQAPELVHACLKSLRFLPNARIVVVDKGNYSDYVEFPDYVLDKYHKGYIPHATMSDMLRLALLSEHGGVWIDSTVLCTYRAEHQDFWKGILDSEFFLYRYFKNGRVNGISTWLIAAKPNNPIVNDTLRLMYAYWKDYNCLVEYYMIHLFISWSAKLHPEYITIMPKGNSYHAIMLGGALEKKYDEDSWNNLTEHVLFHKMTYRHTDKAKATEDSYYNHVINEYLSNR